MQQTAPDRACSDTVASLDGNETNSDSDDDARELRLSNTTGNNSLYIYVER
jgi:hypothetical protein